MMRLWILLLTLLGGAVSLRLLSMEVPDEAAWGQDVLLTCNYALDNDSLDSIKWYLDDVEFFQYRPYDWPSKHFFRLPGMKVDLEKSSNRSVYIREVNDLTAGRYKCVIDADAPSFAMVFREKFMAVVQEEIEIRKIEETKQTPDIYFWYKIMRYRK